MDPLEVCVYGADEALPIYDKRKYPYCFKWQINFSLCLSKIRYIVNLDSFCSDIAVY